MTQGQEVRTLHVVNNIRLWMTWTTMGGELRAPDAMNNIGLWMT